MINLHTIRFPPLSIEKQPPWFVFSKASFHHEALASSCIRPLETTQLPKRLSFCSNLSKVLS